MPDEKPRTTVNYALKASHSQLYRKPSVMISHRCDFYHRWKCKSTIEVLMHRSEIEIVYGCKLHYCTGTLMQNIAETIMKADGFLAVISKSWLHPDAKFPEVEWDAWSSRARDTRRAVAFVVDGVEAPKFISKLMRFEIYSNENPQNNLVPLPDVEFQYSIPTSLQKDTEHHPPPLWVREEDRPRIVEALKILGKPIKS